MASIISHERVCRKCGSVRWSARKPGQAVPGGIAEGLCADCWEAEPPFTQARCYGPHRPPLSVLIYHLKYRHKPNLAPFLASLMEEVVAQVQWKGIEAVVAVPTTRWRVWRRGYNQARLLAAALSVQLGLPLIHHAVTRKGGRSQVGFKLQKRAENVRGVFHVRDHREFLHKTLLLVDDVYTTGATAKEMTRVLLAAGARKVYVLTLTSTGRFQRRRIQTETMRVNGMMERNSRREEISKSNQYSAIPKPH